MKGIIMAGGSGTRLHPITKGTSKQLLQIFDKPMIYYPLSILMLAGIKDVLIICTAQDTLNFQRLLGNGSQFGICISYAVQLSPNGIAEAFIIGEDFIDGDNVCLILGDNIHFGQSFGRLLREVSLRKSGATLFATKVDNPERFGVVGFDKQGRVTSIEEKPSEPHSDYAVTGLYFYDSDVVKIAKTILPSKRGELEITSVNKVYLDKKNLRVELLGRGFSWFDTGTHNSLLEAGLFVRTIQTNQKLQIACLEEIAFRNDWISKEQLNEQGLALKNTDYGQYLLSI